jgi:hypothetical protein
LISDASAGREAIFVGGCQGSLFALLGFLVMKSAEPLRLHQAFQETSVEVFFCCSWVHALPKELLVPVFVPEWAARKGFGQNPFRTGEDFAKTNHCPTRTEATDVSYLSVACI